MSGIHGNRFDWISKNVSSGTTSPMAMKDADQRKIRRCLCWRPARGRISIFI